MSFKKYILVLLAVLFFGVTGFSENQAVFGERREVVNTAGDVAAEVINSVGNVMNNTTFRNAWNAIYTTVQIVDGIVVAPAIITSLPQFYKLVKESKYVLATKRFVKNNFFEFVRGKSVNQAGGTLFSKSAIANINGFSDNISNLTNNQGISVSSFKNLQLGTAVDLASTNPEGLAKLISIRNSIPNPNSNTILQKVIPLNKIDPPLPHDSYRVVTE